MIPGLNEKTVVGIAGAGTMGTGIALVAARCGHRVNLYDSSNEALDAAALKIQRFLDANVQRGRMTVRENQDISRRIRPARDPQDFRECGLVIEAIVEQLEAKQSLVSRLDKYLLPETVLATNTSSLPVSSIAVACANRKDRILGAHFFNPAPVMPLVEVVAGVHTDPAIIEPFCDFLKRWQKVPVTVKDTPGFIVNRVARPYYGEALRILEEGIADTATIDWAMVHCGQFKMGPFDLMDLIGNDVNFAVTKTIFESFFFDPRYRPSLTQQRMVEANRLGRKTSHGYYDYQEGASRPAPREDEELGKQIFLRITAMLMNEAIECVAQRVAAPEAIDTAMTLGVNFPKGLLRWADELGLGTILEQLTALQEEYGEDRYRPSVLLRRMVREGRTFYPQSAG